eukprot:TRINITY_DN12159_c0_g1_i1.p1 TRINITY_DN12159_c0_g1~~TRINITY_DN12159_c0_g1_i1.p1  ORF type:complete len:415 (-),score=58.28 TRINITY_DN12159_c0_g1_i1:79-1137(-)
MAAFGNALASLIIACALFAQRVPRPEARAVKWIFMRGLTGLGASVCLVLSVQVGAPPGDVAALASVNTLVAAFIGRVFLAEVMFWTHGVAFCSTICGVVLITRPAFIFGGSSGDFLLGYTLAVAGGVGQAFIFICSRKAGEVPVTSLALSATFMHALGYALAPLAPFVEDFTLGPLVDSPQLALTWLALLTLMTVLGMLTNSAGAKWCPAAVSATLTTASSIVFGYLAQLLVFDGTLELLPLTGAALMLAAVLFLTLARSPSNSADHALGHVPVRMMHVAEAEAATGAGIDVVAGCAPTNHDDVNAMSLASFIATEFVQREPSREKESQPRLRSAPQTLGAMTAASAVVSMA